MSAGVWQAPRDLGRVIFPISRTPQSCLSGAWVFGFWRDGMFTHRIVKTLRGKIITRRGQVLLCLTHPNLVAMLRVATSSWTLCVLSCDAERRARGVPTRSVGTRS